MTSRGRIDRIESKLSGLLVESCHRCRQRADCCPPCGRAIGETKAEREAALEGFYAEMECVAEAVRQRLDG